MSTSFVMHYLESFTVAYSFYTEVRPQIRYCKLLVSGNKKMSKLWYTKDFFKSGRVCAYANKLHAGKWIDDDEYNRLFCLGLLADAWMEGRSASEVAELEKRLTLDRKTMPTWVSVPYSFKCVTCRSGS